jgi:hypothetical protein
MEANIIALLFSNDLEAQELLKDVMHTGIHSFPAFAF